MKLVETEIKENMGEVILKLAGKWKYTEDFDYGTAEGELLLEQLGNRLSGKIIFTEKQDEGDVSMLQEILTGEVDDLKVRLEAQEYDVIHSENKLFYELDSWFGISVDENTIKGQSIDQQGIVGNFIFERM